MKRLFELYAVCAVAVGTFTIAGWLGHGAGALLGVLLHGNPPIAVDPGVITRPVKTLTCDLSRQCVDPSCDAEAICA